MSMRRLVRWASGVAPLPAWALLAGVYLLSMAISAARWHYGPDTRFYLAWAYRIGGLSEVEAGRRTYDFLNPLESFAGYCWNACDTSQPGITYDWLFRGEEGGLHVQRLVYPLLSAPFVRLFGPPGMLVVPALAFTAYVIMTVVLANRLLGRRWAVPAGLMVILPISIDNFALYAYTETLATALLLACVLVLPIGREVTRLRRDLIVFAVLLALFAFTRQFHYALLLGVVVTWAAVAMRERRRGRAADAPAPAAAGRPSALRNPWAPFAAVGVGATVVVGFVQMLISPGYSLLKPFLEISEAKTVGGIPGVLPGVVWRIIRGEIEEAGQDFGLVLVAALGVAGIVMARRTVFAWLTVGILAGTFALELITALPSQNRYWALSVPLLAVHATAFVARVLTRDDQPMPSTTAGPLSATAGSPTTAADGAPTAGAGEQAAAAPPPRPGVR